jgi:hypothetical protein
MYPLDPICQSLQLDPTKRLGEKANSVLTAILTVLILYSHYIHTILTIPIHYIHTAGECLPVIVFREALKKQHGILRTKHRWGY